MKTSVSHTYASLLFSRDAPYRLIYTEFICVFFPVSCHVFVRKRASAFHRQQRRLKKQTHIKKTKTTLDLCSGLVWAVSLTGGVKCSTLKEGDTKHPHWLAVMSSEHQAACHQHRASHIRGHDPTAAHHFKMVLLQFQARFQVDLDQIRSDQVNLICLNNGSKQGHVNIV